MQEPKQGAKLPNSFNYKKYRLKFINMVRYCVRPLQAFEFQKYEKEGKTSAETFWQHIIKDILKNKLLSFKDFQQRVLQQDIPQHIKDLYIKEERSKLERFQNQMKQYKNKFQICIQEGVKKALYPRFNVNNYCSRKLLDEIHKIDYSLYH